MGDEEIIREFLVESYESLDRLDRELVFLETHPADRETLASVFRAVHTIKGTCGCLGFTTLESLTHAGEALLVQLRDGHQKLSAEITTALLQMLDAARKILVSVEQTGSEGGRQEEGLLSTLRALLVPVLEVSTAPVESVPSSSARRSPPAPDPVQAAPSLGELLIAQGKIAPDDLHNALQKQDAGDQRQLGEILVEHGVVRPQEIHDALNVQRAMRGTTASASTIRVDVALLDQLMNLVGELVLVRNQITQLTRSWDEASLLSVSQKLNLTTRQLQERVMKARLQPIGTVWAKFPRTVRDLAQACGKQVKLEMEGTETELDRTIIEAIQDPLTHLVRNAVDHGIEPPELRLRTGKKREGVLSLKASHEGAYVIIEVGDDGGGLSIDRIRSKAVKSKLVSADRLAQMNEHETIDLIFQPGLSTAEVVTSVSGRGVGLDVVRTNIEKIGGSVDVKSSSGKGTTMRMKIPLTLAIIPAVIISAARRRYAIPQMSVLEFVRIEGEQINRIETVHGAPVYRLRGELLPLVYLNDLLRGSADSNEADAGASGSWIGDSALSQAKAAHRQIMSDIRTHHNETSFLVARGSMPRCVLDEWIGKTGLAEFSTLAEIYELARADKSFHAVVDTYKAAKSTGNKQEIDHALEQLAKLHRRTTALMSAVGKRIIQARSLRIVVLQAQDRKFGLIVDDVTDTAEIVVKPLNRKLKSLNIYSGATVMGNGELILILDSMGLANYAHIWEPDYMRTEQQSPKSTESVVPAHSHSKAVLIEYGAAARMAIPMEWIHRLEEFTRHSVESSGGLENVQYRGQILRLLRITDILGLASQQLPPRTRESVPVVICRSGNHDLGLVVERIVDVVDQPIVLDQNHKREGILGLAVIQQQVTEILDVPNLFLGINKIAERAAAHA